MAPYETINGVIGLIGKNIDYSQGSSSDMTFTNKAEFTSTILGVNKTEVFVGDHFMVVRNGSKFRMNNLFKIALDLAYQFNGNQVTFLKSRDISVNIPVNRVYYETGNTNVHYVCTNGNSTYYSSWNYTYGNNTCNKTQVGYNNPYVDADKELSYFRQMWIDDTQTNTLTLLLIF